MSKGTTHYSPTQNYHNQTYLTVNREQSLGIKGVMDQTLAYIGKNTPIHLSYDIDGLDPAEAPSAGTSVPGGLTLEQGNYIGTRVHETGNLVSLDLVMLSSYSISCFPPVFSR